MLERVAILATAAALAGCATTAPAWCMGTPAAVTVVPWSGAGPTAAALARRPLLRVKIERPGPKLASKSGADDPAVARVVEASDAATAALERARQQYRKLEFRQAVAALTRARESLARVTHAVEQIRLLRELSLQIGINHLALKDQAAAMAALQEAVALGHAGPPAGKYPPEVEAALGRARAELTAAAPGTISVTTRPAGARLLVDGKERGRTPATVQVPPGLHHLYLDLELHQPRVLQVRAASARVEQAEVYLKPSEGDALRRQLRHMYDDGAAPPAGATTGLARVFGPGRALLTVDGAGAGLTATAAWTGPQQASHRCTAKSPAALARCLEPPLFKLGGGVGQARADPKPAASSPLYKRWWFWAVVGGGAAALAGGAVGIYYGTRGDPGTDVYLEK